MSSDTPPADTSPNPAQETLQKVFSLAHEGRLAYSDMLMVTKVLKDAGNHPLAENLYQIWHAYTAAPLVNSAGLDPDAPQRDRTISTDIGRPLPANVSCGIDVDAICTAHDAGGRAAAVAEVRARLGIRDDAVAINVVEHGLSLRNARLHTALLFCTCLGPLAPAEDLKS